MLDFNKYISSYEYSWIIDFIIENGTCKEYARNQVFSKVDQVHAKVGYIQRGAFRYTAFSADGTKHNVGFAFEGSFVCDYASLSLQQPSEVEIETMSHSVVYMTDLCAVNEAFKENNEKQEASKRIADILFSEAYSRFISHYTTSAEERYWELITNNPKILNIIPLKELASYLHIRPETLSRIRKNLARRMIF